MTQRARLTFAAAVALTTIAASAVALTPSAAGATAPHWTMQHSGTTQPLYSVDFVDANHGWAVGDKGTIVGTTDGGAHWVREPSGTTDTLWKVSFADRLHGWVSGYHWTSQQVWTLRATSDGGKHWHVAGHYAAWSVSAVDATHVWTGGDTRSDQPVVIARTTNGKTWTKMGAPMRGYLGGLYFVSRNVGYAAGTRFSPNFRAVMLKTVNGGRTWAVQVTRFQTKFSNLTFSDANHGWAAGYEQSKLLRTVNGGKMWVSVPTNVGVTAMSFMDANHGYGVAPGYAKKYTVVYYTRNGGRTWSPSYNADKRWGTKSNAFMLRTAYAVCAVNGTHVWAVGSNGRIVRYGT